MKRNYALDGLRGYAALAVTFYHGILQFNTALTENVLYTPIQDLNNFHDIINKLFLTVFNGETAVVLFFILSGVVLFDSLQNDNNSKNSLKISNFAIKRLIRIYPTLLLCLAFFFIMNRALDSIFPNMFCVFSIQQLIENSLLYKISMHGATWTLQVEILAVPFILLGYYIHKLFGSIGLIGFFCYSVLIFDNANLFYYIPVQAIRICLMYFTIAFIIPTEFGKRMFTNLHKNSWCIALFLTITTRHIVPHSSITGMLVQLIFAWILVGLIYYNNAGLLNGLLENRISRYLGKISFSYYLYNVVFLNIIGSIIVKLAEPASHPLSYGLLLSVLATVCSIPFSHLSEKYIERGSVKLGKLLCSINPIKSIFK